MLVSTSLVFLSSNSTKEKATNKQPISPTREEKLPNVTLSSGKIAFVKDGSLFLLDNKGVLQLTKNERVGKFRWSRDGKNILYITEKLIEYETEVDIPYENKRKREADRKQTMTKKNIRQFGTVVRSVDLETKIQRQLVAAKYTDSELKDAATGKDDRSLSLEDFDMSHDGKQIIYIQDGVWLKNTVTNKEEKIAKNIYFKDDASNIAELKHYGDVSWNPVLDTVLLHYGVWECAVNELYYPATKQFSRLEDMQTCNMGSWTPDGTQILSTAQTGRGEGGLWLTELTAKKTKKIVGDTGKYALSVLSATVTKEKRMIAIIEPFSEEKTDLPVEHTALYEVNPSGSLKLLKQLQENTNEPIYATNLQSSPDGASITYLIRDANQEYDEINQKYNLYLLAADGSREQMLLGNISSYVWTPTSALEN